MKLTNTLLCASIDAHGKEATFKAVLSNWQPDRWQQGSERTATTTELQLGLLAWEGSADSITLHQLNRHCLVCRKLLARARVWTSLTPLVYHYGHRKQRTII